MFEKIKVFSPLLRLKDEVEFQWEKEHQEAFNDIKRYLTNPPVLVPPLKCEIIYFNIRFEYCKHASARR